MYEHIVSRFKEVTPKFVNFSITDMDLSAD